MKNEKENCVCGPGRNNLLNQVNSREETIYLKLYYHLWEWNYFLIYYYMMLYNVIKIMWLISF